MFVVCALGDVMLVNDASRHEQVSIREYSRMSRMAPKNTRPRGNASGGAPRIPHSDLRYASKSSSSSSDSSPRPVTAVGLCGPVNTSRRL